MLCNNETIQFWLSFGHPFNTSVNGVTPPTNNLQNIVPILTSVLTLCNSIINPPFRNKITRKWWKTQRVDGASICGFSKSAFIRFETDK